MVRMSKASTRQIHQQYKLNNKLFNRHFFNILILFVVGFSVALYVFLVKIEEKAAAVQDSTDIAHEQVTAVRKGADPLAVRPVEVLSETLDKEHPESAAKMVPASSILPASRVLSLGLPFLVYGTAWKKEDTSHHVSEAVRAGFRFIDTACQPKHYNEPGVGAGWTTAAKELGLQRTDMFLQTKFTSTSGQDPNNIPYDHTASLEAQVARSLEVSLRNLQTSYLDSWVMHSPMPTIEETMVVYRVMEQAVDDGKVLRLGISNCYDYDQFTTIYDMARIKPSVLQNRFYGDSNWDQDLRRFCKENSIWYQSFWTLTANRHALATNEAQNWASSKQLTPQTLLYAYLMSLGYGTPLDGTTNVDHMKEDIAVMERLQSGEKIFADDQKIRNFERLLGF